MQKILLTKKSYCKRYYLKNKEKLKEQARKYRLLNKDKMKKRISKRKNNLMLCKVCNENFHPWTKSTIYCSSRCYFNDNNSLLRNHPKIIIKCLNCQKEISLNLYNSKHRKYCSTSCANTYNQRNGSWNKGIPHTAETKRKISEGVKQSRPKNWINPSTRPEVRKKISETIKKLFKDPRKNPRYVDGRSQEEYPFDFDTELKEFIRKRDNFKCQICGASNHYRKLDVHHLDSKKHNLSKDNLISLCQSCHQKIHYKESKICNAY